jgi:Fe-S cluster assembly protein SufD
MSTVPAPAAGRATAAFGMTFSDLAARRRPGPDAWIQAHRRESHARFMDLGLPTPRMEAWRATNVASIGAVAWQPAQVAGADVASAMVAAESFESVVGPHLVFVNGRYREDLSRVPADDRMTVKSLAAALAEDRAIVEPRLLARRPADETHAFRALNAALLEDGAFVRLRRSHLPPGVVHVLHVCSASEPMAVHPRNLLVLEEESHATVLETYVSLGGTTFTNAVTDVALGPSAVLRHVRVQREAEGAFHLGSVRARLDRGARLFSHVVSMGAALSRTEVEVELAGEGAECSLDGLYVAGGTQAVDHQTFVDHAVPHGTSRQLQVGLLGGRARGVFNGKVIVREDAQATDARQSNRNLLLSSDALVDTKPQLEIRANDVKCTHGATIGQLREDALFYLRSRGIGREQARGILTHAFASEVLDRLPIQAARAALDAVLVRRIEAALGVAP